MISYQSDPGDIASTLSKVLALACMEPEFRSWAASSVDVLTDRVHALNVAAGWWSDPATGAPKDRNVGELLALVHSEISEALEGHRKDLMDDKLPHRKMIDVELADAVIRIMDIAGARCIPLGTIIFEKLEYNSKREDHKPENRLKEGGKAF